MRRVSHNSGLTQTLTSISALKRFEPSDPMWSVLRTLYDRHAPPLSTQSSSIKQCGFCGRVCGRTLRQCAEMNGGRKALKEKIRQVEAVRHKQNGDTSEVNALFQCYLQVSEWGSGRAVTDRPTLQWPKPVKPVKV